MMARHFGSPLLSTAGGEGFWRWALPGSGWCRVASWLRVREVADPKCRWAGESRPRWISVTPRSALPDLHLGPVSGWLSGVGEELSVDGI